MRIIDCHAHIKGGDAEKREFTADVLLTQADEAGVERTCVFSMSLPSRESNDLTRARIRGHEDRLVPFCHVIPTEGPLALAELDRALGDWGWTGVKMHWGEYHDQLSLPVLSPTLEKIGEYSVPVLIDTVYQWELGQEVVRAFPQVTFVIAHWGSPQQPALMEQWAHFAGITPNCYLDCSYCHAPWKMPECFERAGAAKVLFGSDAPLLHPLVEAAKVRVCHLPPEEEAMVFWKNAARLFRIPME